jgi:hypothetical protein
MIVIGLRDFLRIADRRPLRMGLNQSVMESEGGDMGEAVATGEAVDTGEAADMEEGETVALEAEATVALGMEDVVTTPVVQATVDFIPPLHQNDPLV